MKLAIVSDLHLGYERFEEDAFLQAKDALEKASEMGDAILIAGDIFHKREPKLATMAQAISIFRALSRKQWRASISGFSSGAGKPNSTSIPVLAIPGTHERVAEGKENAISLLALAGLLVDISEATATIELGGERVAVFGLGGVAEGRTKEVLSKLDPKPVQGAFNVFMMHQSVYELLPFGDTSIGYDDLPKGFDLYLDGHIHKKVEARAHGKKFLIPGSTVLTQLKEDEKESKGFILFDTKTGTHEFIKITSRPFFPIRIKLKNSIIKDAVAEAERNITEILSKSNTKPIKPIIRVIFEGTTADGIQASDLPARVLISKYSDTAILEIDMSGITDPKAEKELSDIRANKLDGMPVKDMGMSALMSKLKAQKLDGSINFVELFEILSSAASKEKAVKQALELLEKSEVKQ